MTYNDAIDDDEDEKKMIKDDNDDKWPLQMIQNDPH